MTEDLQHILIPGLSREDVHIVEDQHTAGHLGSGDLRVLASPMMILFMEITARKLLADLLPENLSSVGTRVDVRHLAPAAVGAEIITRAEITAVDEQIITLHVDAWDGHTLVGTGLHWRFLIDEARFMRRLTQQS